MSSVNPLKLIYKECTEETQYPRKIKINIDVNIQCKCTMYKLIFEASVLKSKTSN